MAEASVMSGVGVWTLNVVSSVGIIMVNKLVMKIYLFRYATTLTCMHYAATAAVGMVTTALGYQQSKDVPWWDLVWFALVADVSIVSMNFSLMLNKVGFYQIAKLSIIPTMCVLEYFLNAKHFTREVQASVVVVMLGVGIICTVKDVHTNVAGFVAAVFAVLSTALQQIYIGSLQKKYNIGSIDLLSKTAPVQAVSLVIVAPLLDLILTGQSVLDYQMTFASGIYIALSCFLAIFCNLSQFMVIGKFSAVTFQVVGHTKTVLVLFLGWLLFDSNMTAKNLVGMAIAVLGMVLYSWAVEKGKVKFESKVTPLKLQDVKDSAFAKEVEEKVGLLKDAGGAAEMERLKNGSAV